MLILPWLVPWDQSSFEAFKKAQPKINRISPTYFSLSADFQLNETKDPNKDWLIESGVEIFPLVVNEGFKADVAKVLLETKEARNKTATILVRKVVEDNYPGINVDFEGPFGDYRNEYSEFIELLAEMLHKEGKEISVDVISQTKEPTPEHTWGYPFDYARLGAVVDYLVLMGYDYSSVYSPPGPVAPNDWLNSVKNFTISCVPKEKVILGLPFYGRHWSTDVNGTHSTGKGVTYQQAIDLANNWQVAPILHESGALYLEYQESNGVREQVFFEDAYTLLEKIKIANDLAGIAFWRLGQEDPRIWSYL